MLYNTCIKDLLQVSGIGTLGDMILYSFCVGLDWGIPKPLIMAGGVASGQDYRSWDSSTPNTMQCYSSWDNLGCQNSFST